MIDKKIKILIVNANFYEDISQALIEGATNYLISEDVDFDIVHVPGSLEIGQVIKFYCEKNKGIDGFIALGCIIKGETYHFEIVSNESARFLTNLSLKYSCPIANGILTVYKKSDAFTRSDVKNLNKGKEFAKACLSLIKIKKNI